MSSVKSVAIALGVWLACVSSATAQAPALNAPQLPPVPEPPPAPGETAVQPVFEGPLHEAFLSPAKDRDPQHVDKAPPAPIAERPGVDSPSERARWIPGYWEWDPTRNDFTWVTGCWRVPPPGKFWVDGYWKRDDQGWYRVPGFWSDRLTDRIDYRKTGPPADRPEENPGPAPAEDTFYVPGQYEPDGDGVAWRPGFWTKAQPGWAWVPSQWVQQPEGWIFQPGYWDRTLEDRGTLFTPAVVNDAVGGTTQDLVYQPMQQVAPATYGSLYGALGRPSVYYDGYPGCYYDPDGQYYGYAQYGTLGLYSGYLDFPYAGSVGYPYLTPAYGYGSYGGYGYGLSGYGLNYLGGLGCGLGSTLGLGYGYGYGGYGYGYGGYGLGLLGGLGRFFGLGLGFGYPYYGYGLGGLGYGLGFGGYGWGFPGYGLGWGGYGWGFPGFGSGWGYPGFGLGWGGLGWGGLGWGGWGNRNHHRGGYPFHGGPRGSGGGGWGGGGWGGGGWAGGPGRQNPGRWVGNPGFPNSGGVGRLPRGGVAPGPRQGNPGGGRASLPPNLAMHPGRGHTPPAASMPFANPFGGSAARHAGVGRRAGPVAVGSNTGVYNAPHVQNVRHVVSRPALNPAHRAPALGGVGQVPNNRALSTPRGSQVLPGASAGRALGGLPPRGTQAGNLGTIGRLHPGSNPAIPNQGRQALTNGAQMRAAIPGPSVGTLSGSALPNRGLANPALRAGGASALPNAAQLRGNVPVRSGVPNAGALGAYRPGLATGGMPNAGFAQQAHRGSVGLPSGGFAQPMNRGSMGGFGGMPSGGFAQPMPRGSMGGFGGLPAGGFGGARHVGGGFGGMPSGGFGRVGGGMGHMGGLGGAGHIGGGMGHVGGMGHGGGHR